MTTNSEPVPALRPEDLGTFFLERANAGDVEGLVALYEPEAVLAVSSAGRKLAVGDRSARLAVLSG